MHAHRVEHPRLVPGGVAPAQLGRLVEAAARGDVPQPEIVRRGLVGHHIGADAAPHQLGQHLGDVAHQAHRERPALPLRVLHQSERAVEVGLQPVAVAGVHPPADPGLVHVHAQAGGAVHRGGQRLGAAHPAEPAGHHQPALQRAAEVLPGALGEGLVRALEDPLGPDVDPRAGGHLPVHREAQGLEPAELLPGGPAGHEVGVGDQHPGRLGVGAKHAHGLPALHQQGLVVLQPPQGGDQPLVRGPVAGGLAAAAVHHQLLRTLGDRRIQVVHQHAQGGLLVPALTGEGGPGGRVDRRERGERHGWR